MHMFGSVGYMSERDQEYRHRVGKPSGAVQYAP